MEQGDAKRPEGRGASRKLSDRVRSLQLGDRTSQSAPRSRYLPWAVSFVLLLTTAAFAYRAYRVGGLTPASPEPREKKQAGPGPAIGSVASVGEVVLQAKGYVIPISLVQVSPKVGGQLIEIDARFREGARFKEGDILARIEDTDYQAEYDQALFSYLSAAERYTETRKTQPEEIKMAEQELEEARQNTQQLKLDLERNKRLMVGSALAQRDMEVARFSYEANASRVRRLESALRMVRDAKRETRLLASEFDKWTAEGILDKARWRLENTIIRAPITGTILTKKAEKGNIVNPSAFSSGISASLCEMANLRELEIDLSIQERDIPAVKDDQECWIMPEAYQADKDFLELHPKGYKGKVSRLMPTADRAKGAIPVRVLILDIPESEEGRYLRPDMGALVSFLKVPEKKADGKANAGPGRGLEGAKPQPRLAGKTPRK
jgi:HlyD family secretion protein